MSVGADSIHLVDLDGAKKGCPVNQKIVIAVKQATGLFAEIGGGIRTLADIEMYLDAGLDRVILGTSAVRNKAPGYGSGKKIRQTNRRWY